MKVQVKDFMSSPVLTAVERDTVGEVRFKMKNKRIHAIPIVEMINKLPEFDIVIKGIVTATDLSDNLADNTIIGNIKTSNVHVIHKDSSAKAAAKMMLKHKVHHLVVMDEGEITGMVSSLDFVRLVEQYALD
jgi:CBS domain-containing protein